MNQWNFILFEPVCLLIFLAFLFKSIQIWRRKRVKVLRYVLAILFFCFLSLTITMFNLFLFFLRGRKLDYFGARCLVQYDYQFEQEQVQVQPDTKVDISTACFVFSVAYNSLASIPSVLINVAILLFSAPIAKKFILKSDQRYLIGRVSICGSSFIILMNILLNGILATMNLFEYKNHKQDDPMPSTFYYILYNIDYVLIYIFGTGFSFFVFFFLLHLLRLLRPFNLNPNATKFFRFVFLSRFCVILLRIAEAAFYVFHNFLLADDSEKNKRQTLAGYFQIISGRAVNENQIVLQFAGCFFTGLLLFLTIFWPSATVAFYISQRERKTKRESEKGNEEKAKKTQRENESIQFSNETSDFSLQNVLLKSEEKANAEEFNGENEKKKKKEFYEA